MYSIQRRLLLIYFTMLSAKFMNHEALTLAVVTFDFSNMALKRQERDYDSLDVETSDEESDDDYEVESHKLGFGFDEDSKADESDEEWSLGPTKNNVIPFSGATGPHNLSLKEPLECFEALISQQILEMMLKNINKQAHQLFSTKYPASSELNEFKPVTMEELRVFLGLLLNMSVIQLPEINDYWNTSQLFGFQSFTKHMSRRKFKMIWKCLDFDPKTGEGGNMFEIINQCNNIIENVYLPDKVLCIDKSQVSGTNKRNKLSNRVEENNNLYLLTDEHGFVLKIVSCKNGNKSINEIAETLLANRLGVGHAVYMNNASVRLANNLVQNNTHITGVFKTKPKDIPIAMSTDSNPECVTFYSKRGVCVMKYQNKPPSYILSTEHYEDPQSNLNKEINQKPGILSKFEKHMVGVQKHEQLASYFSSTYTQRKMPRNKRLLLHLLNVMFCNSYILYKRYSDKPLKILQFRFAVIDGLVSQSKYAAIRMETSNDWHTSYKLPRDPKTNRYKRKRCVTCWKKFSKRVDTISYCPKCPNNPGLCQGQCFEEYHATGESGVSVTE